VKIAAGRGRALVYELDAKRQRIADPRKGVVGRFREAERELHWAVVTGVIDHHKISASLGTGRRSDPPSAERMYRGVELERQALREDGTWSRWQRVDREASSSILDNVPALETERVSQEFLASPLVEPLPWLTDHDWEGVDVEEFLPPERRDRRSRRSSPIPAPPPRRAAPPRLMFRALDFTVEPGRTYRYRARLAFVNPGAMPSPDRREFSPWSEATTIVKVPSP
jgi:hypothetical protein